MLARCLLAVVTILMLSGTQADARRGGFGMAQFGTQETPHFLQDVRLKGQSGEQLYLGYMTRTFSFFLPAYLSDAGYVLGIKGDSERYFKMPAGAELTRLQQSGALPKPLPQYRLTTGDYAMGYLLWIVLLVAGIGYALWAALYRHVTHSYEGAHHAIDEAQRARRI